MNTITRNSGSNASLGNGHANGQAPPLSQTPVADWRRAALIDALRCRERSGSPEYSLLRSLQTELPEYRTRVFSENRTHTETAFRRLLPGLEVCIEPSLQGEDDVPLGPIFGWWRGVWPADGNTYEIVLAPNMYCDGDWIVAGPTQSGATALAQAAIDYASRDAVRCQIFSNGSWRDAPELSAEVTRTQWSDIILAPALLADIRSAIDGFFDSKLVFDRMNFPWRRGVLLVGPPGTGKTMVCRAAASAHPDIPFLYVRDLRAGRGNRDMLAAIFSRARRLAPCILALEDMDGLIDKENRTMLLNELDGFKKNDGLLIIASSNHPEKIDEALLKRPSRFDRVYHVGLPAQSERESYACLLLDRVASANNKRRDTLAERIGAATNGFTPALIKEAILSSMLEQAQAGDETCDFDRLEPSVLRQIEWLRKYLKKASDPLGFSESIGESSEIGFRTRG